MATKPLNTDKICAGAPSVGEAKAFFTNLVDYYNAAHGLWATSTAKAVGDVVRASVLANYEYVCIQAGTTGTTEPIWPTTVGATVTDGTVIWNCQPQHAGNASVMGGFKNKIINGNFNVNQRGVAGTVTLAAGGYGHDRWKAGASGCTYTYSAGENITMLTITAGSLLQIIEGVNLFTGTHVLSWGGTAQGRIGAGSFGASGITSSVTGGSNLTIEFGTGTLSKVQFEEGPVVTRFESRNHGQELYLCQRYYEADDILHDYYYPYFSGADMYMYIHIPFSVRKRALPTMSYAAGLIGRSTNHGLQGTGYNGFYIYIGNSGAATAQSGAYNLYWTANAEL